MISRLIRWLAAGAWLAALVPAHGFLIPSINRVVEYQNESTGHYLLLSGADDMLFVDRGLAGPGWGRTGYYFDGYSFNPNGPTPTPVCRFYSAMNNSHFFTASTVECDILRQPDTGWTYEKTAFFMEIPAATGCPAGRAPVYRLYNNRHAQHDANHRYTADAAVRATMQAAGWADEGIAFCATQAGIQPEKSLDLIPPGNDTIPLMATGDCENHLGGCIGLTQLALMPTLITSWLPPSYVVRNNAYPWGEIERVTGVEQTFLRTSLPMGSPDLLQRSFVQAYPSNPLPIGVHLRGAERLSGIYAGVSPMRVFPGSASAAGDDRVFPWHGTRNRTLVLSTELSVTRARRTNEAAHAYGHPMLEFVDRMSGRKLYVTLQAFGTLPAGDYVGPDATTGWTIVSTPFRANPLFGKRLSGEYVQCDPGSATACIPGRTAFKFALDRAGFQSVLDRARGVDPALSANVSDFFLASFRMHNETYLDAELGMALYRMTLEIFVAGAP